MVFRVPDYMVEQTSLIQMKFFNLLSMLFVLYVVVISNSYQHKSLL